MTTGWLDRCIFVATSAGTTDFVPASAVTGYLTPANASAVNGVTYRYAAQNTALTQWEVGYGAWNSGSNTLPRTTVELSSDSNNKVSFSSAPNVMITALGQDFANVFAGDSGSGAVPGLVPAAATGDAAANRYLKASGVWTTVPSTAPGGSNTQIQFNQTSAFAGDANLTWTAGQGMFVKAVNPGSGTVSTSYAVQIGTASAGSGVIGDLSGLRIERQDAIGTTTSYNMMSIGTSYITPTNRLGGNLLQSRVAIGNYADVGHWRFPPRGATEVHEAEPVSFIINNYIEGDFSPGTGNERDGMIAYFGFKQTGAGGTAVGFDLESSLNHDSGTTGGLTNFFCGAYNYQAFPVSSVFSGAFTAENNGGGTLFAMQPLQIIANNNGGGAVTNVRNIGIFCTNNGTATVTNWFGILVNALTNNGTVTNARGIQIGDWSSQGGTISYNLESKGANSLNIFEGWTQIQAAQKRVSTQFDKTNSTTLANITGLSVNVKTSRIYQFESILFTNSNSAAGVRAAIGGSATASTIIYDGYAVDANAVLGQQRATALAVQVAAATAVATAIIHINGLISVGAGGTLTVQFAQNAENGTASSVLPGSYFMVQDMA